MKGCKWLTIMALKNWCGISRLRLIGGSTSSKRKSQQFSFEISLECGNVGNSCLTNAHFMLASFTMVFGYSWYLFIDECILSGISVRAVSARCFTTCHAMGTLLAAWVEVR